MIMGVCFKNTRRKEENFMDFVFNCLLLVLGFVMLIKGADWFVDGAAGIASKFGIPQIVIGLTIVAMGTSAPEAAVSITAALNDNAGITVGNVVGSNVLNILIILGVTAVITSVAIQQSTLKYEIPFMTFITLVFMGLGLTGNAITRLEGVVLWIFFIVYFIYLFILAKKGKVEDKKEERSIIKLLFYGIGGMAIVVLGSDITVDNAVSIATILGIDERVIGLTIIALGTSLPELVTSVTAAKKGNADIAIGNIVGSNIFNILFVVGTSALITPVAFATEFWIDTLIVTLSGVLLFFCVLKNKKLTRPGGIIMLVCYAGYLVYLFV